VDDVSFFTLFGERQASTSSDASSLSFLLHLPFIRRFLFSASSLASSSDQPHVLLASSPLTVLRALPCGCSALVLTIAVFFVDSRERRHKKDRCFLVFRCELGSNATITEELQVTDRTTEASRAVVLRRPRRSRSPSTSSRLVEYEGGDDAGGPRHRLVAQRSYRALARGCKSLSASFLLRSLFSPTQEGRHSESRKMRE
jgi:hypothetical protein